MSERREEKHGKNVCTYECADIYTQLKAEFNFHFYIKTQKEKAAEQKKK